MPTDERDVDDAVEEIASIEMSIGDVRREPKTAEGYEPVVQITSGGPIELRYYAVPGATRTAIFVGGAGGGYDTPVCGWLYPRMCEALQRDGITALRVRYRHPNDLDESVLDVLAGIGFLEAEGVTSVALVGHSFGGAVVINAAAISRTVRTCIPMTTQSYGAEPAWRLGPRCSILLVHGTADEILPPSCSEYVFRIAKEPKKLVLKEGARHGLGEWADDLPDILRDWITRHLPRE